MQSVLHFFTCVPGSALCSEVERRVKSERSYDRQARGSRSSGHVATRKKPDVGSGRARVKGRLSPSPDAGI